MCVGCSLHIGITLVLPYSLTTTHKSPSLAPPCNTFLLVSCFSFSYSLSSLTVHVTTVVFNFFILYSTFATLYIYPVFLFILYLFCLLKFFLHIVC